ncbi:MAG: hypothetical protein JWN69_257 [Alphaproteobacteria bacterium]|nr:hypothetical protein [Alphaproteobacteria bacterium]
MTTWRARDMTEADCRRFKRSFEFVYRVTPFNKDMMLYLHTADGEPGGTIVMSSYQAIPLELLYPGAWRDSGPPGGEGWSLLAGFVPTDGTALDFDREKEGPVAAD